MVRCPECNSNLEKIGYFYGNNIKWGCPRCDAVFKRHKNWDTNKIEITRLKYIREGWNKYYTYSQWRDRG